VPGLASARKCDVELPGGEEVRSQVSEEGRKSLALCIVYNCTESQSKEELAPRDLHIRELELKVNSVKYLCVSCLTRWTHLRYVYNASRSAMNHEECTVNQARVPDVLNDHDWNAGLELKDMRRYASKSVAVGQLWDD